jgi:hypothetical protein
LQRITIRSSLHQLQDATQNERQKTMQTQSYKQQVNRVYNNIVIGNIQPTLKDAEDFASEILGLELGGKALEVAFDSLVKFGIPVGEI